MNHETHAVYVISVAAELAGMHPQTLRIYERRGLVQPSRTTGGKQRRYSNADIQRLFRISELTQAGMNLEGIRQVLELETQVALLRAQMMQLQDQLVQLTTDQQRGSRYELVPIHQVTNFFGVRQNPSQR